MGADYYRGNNDSPAHRCATMLERYAKSHGIDLSPHPQLDRLRARVARKTQAAAQDNEDAGQARAPAQGCSVEQALEGIRYALRKVGMQGPYAVVAEPVATAATYHVLIGGRSPAGNPSMRRLATYQMTEARARLAAPWTTR